MTDIRHPARSIAPDVLAHLGDAAQCEERANFALRSAAQLGLWSIAAFARAALGASALAQRDTDEIGRAHV